MKNWIKEQIDSGAHYDDIIGMVNDEVVSQILMKTHGNQTQAAIKLDMNRGTLRKYINESKERGA
ncbi:MAG: helix-turn-helix domain-containing protein [Aeromonadaceae bacterium]